VLGSVGLGFGEHAASGAVFEPAYVLCVIPFVCTFVDLICLHNTIRILIIANFLVSIGDPYEGFLSHLGRRVNKTPHLRTRKGAQYFFELEDWALQWSSVALSLMLVAFGAFRLAHPHAIKDWIFPFSGIGGIILSIVTWLIYRRRIEALAALSGSGRWTDGKSAA